MPPPISTPPISFEKTVACAGTASSPPTGSSDEPLRPPEERRSHDIRLPRLARAAYGQDIRTDQVRPPVSGKIARIVFRSSTPEGGDPRPDRRARGMKQVTDTGASRPRSTRSSPRTPTRWKKARPNPNARRLVRRPGDEGPAAAEGAKPKASVNELCATKTRPLSHARAATRSPSTTNGQTPGGFLNALAIRFLGSPSCVPLIEGSTSLTSITVAIPV